MRSAANLSPEKPRHARRIAKECGLHRIALLGCMSVPLVSGLVAIGIVLGTSGSCRGEEPPPNVLLILTDDQGWGDLGCFGAKDLDTPNLDRLAAGGMRMTNFYANCPVCSPTRAALLTGRYPESVGVPGVIRTHPRNSWGSLNPNAKLLPAILAERGYATAIVGKWHLGLAPGDDPNSRGFEFFHGFLGDMMDDYWTHRRHGLNYMRQDQRVIDPAGHASDLFSDWACDYLRTWAAREQSPSGRPFFLYLAYNAPHVPIQPPTEALAAYRHRHPDASAERAGLAALIEHMDAGIGRVLNTLRELGLEEKTLVLFSSDNGGQLNVGASNGPYRDGKGTVYEGGIRVPMIARLPGRISAGTQSDAVALTMDLFTTVLDAAGIPKPPEADGVSLMPILTGNAKETPERDLFWVRLEQGRWIWAARRGNWKLVRPLPPKDRPARDELYDLAADPRETTDLSDRRPEELRLMQELLERHIAASRDVPWKPGERPIPDAAVLFRSGQGGYHTYRIPALAVGAKGTLLAFCEGRKTSARDDGDIDLLLRRSEDGGRTWSEPTLVYEEGGDAPITIGNPCPVLDARTGTLWLAFCRNNDRVFVISTQDDGLTWSAPREITADVKEKDWDWYATGPGHGIQLRFGPHAGRLVFPCDHRVRDGDGSWQRRGRSHVIFSDDGGATFERGEPTDWGMNECQAVELKDGRLLLDMRNYLGKNCRAFAVSEDAGRTWSQPVWNETVYCPVCQAAIIGFTEQPQVLLHSGPGGPGRAGMTLRVSYDQGKTWPYARTISQAPAAYSDLAVLEDGTICLIFETGEAHPYQRIDFVRLILSDLEPAGE
ncbi:hypothetical protein JCM17478_07600 [Thermopirellula anaerolimosa]